MEQAGTGIADVVVLHAHGSMRTMLRLVLTEEGYTVSEASTCAALLRRLRRAAEPVVVVAGNTTADYRAEAECFGRLMAHARLARRHRYVLLCTLPEWVPADLRGTLSSLQVPILPVPPSMSDLLDAVARAAGRTPAAQAEDGPVE